MKTEELRTKYPALFSGCREISINDGWAELVDQACAKLSAQARVIQVKEKFGGMRLYISGSDMDHKVVEMAENDSYRTCETCGTRDGTTTEGNWLKSLCPPCRADRNKQRAA